MLERTYTECVKWLFISIEYYLFTFQSLIDWYLIYVQCYNGNTKYCQDDTVIIIITIIIIFIINKQVYTLLYMLYWISIQRHNYSCYIGYRNAYIITLSSTAHINDVTSLSVWLQTADRRHFGPLIIHRGER